MRQIQTFWQIFLISLVVSASSLLLSFSLFAKEHSSAASALILGFTSVFICIIAAFYYTYRHHVFFNKLQEVLRAARDGSIPEKFPFAPSTELASLLTEIRLMAEGLAANAAKANQQANDMRSVFSSMRDAVIATDSSERVINLNSAAEELLGSSLAAVRGVPLNSVVRSSALQRLVQRTVSSQEHLEGELSFGGNEERTFHANTSVLRDSAGKCIGALVILIDVTHTLKLENLRKEFVANVSHELKTPITSVKGFIETLLDGAMHNPETAKNFLEIALKQAERLNAIIEDLLSLSRIEQSEAEGTIDVSLHSARGVFTSALRACEPQAQAKHINIELEGDLDIRLRMNPNLIEQALVNLIDNAIKYSESDTCITISIEQLSTETVIAVHDHGAGIESEHLPRIFERFYRTDKARSRKIGGTGLGLAIVKHIAQAHGGYARVRSIVGSGSTFSIHLPRWNS